MALGQSLEHFSGNEKRRLMYDGNSIIPSPLVASLSVRRAKNPCTFALSLIFTINLISVAIIFIFTKIHMVQQSKEGYSYREGVNYEFVLSTVIINLKNTCHLLSQFCPVNPSKQSHRKPSSISMQSPLRKQDSTWHCSLP